MSQDFSHIIQSTKDGVLDTPTPPAHVVDLVKRAVAEEKPIVLHLHGGLVGAKGAYQTVNKIQSEYLTAGLFPVFVVWRTNVFDAIKNAGELAKKPLFERLLQRLLPFLVAKFTGLDSKSGTGAGLEPDEVTVESELAKRATGGVPFSGITGTPTSDELTVDEHQLLQARLEADNKLQAEWEKEVAAVVPGLAGVGPAEAPPPGPRLDSTIASEAAAARESGGKSLLGAKLAWHGVVIASRVIKRRFAHSDHGLHTTLVEEILRELFIESLGSAVWGFMKRDAGDTFDNAGQSPERAGWLFLRLLAEQIRDRKLAGKPTPTLSIVAHSAGAVYACRLLEHLAVARLDKMHPLHQTDFRIRRLVFLAPACRFELFDAVLQKNLVAPLFDEFRLFGLTDADESGYYEVRFVYPASLLYLVSGLFEAEEKAGVCDQPIVGMQRYYRDEHPYTQGEVSRVKAFLERNPDRLVLSGEDRGDGLRCDSRRHGELDNSEATLKSYLHFLSRG